MSNVVYIGQRKASNILSHYKLKKITVTDVCNEINSSRSALLFSTCLRPVRLRIEHEGFCQSTADLRNLLQSVRP